MKKLLLFLACLSCISLPGETFTRKVLHLYVLGTGTVGTCFLAQIEQNRKKFIDQYDIDLQVLAVANRKNMLFCDEALCLKGWRHLLNDSKEPMLWPNFFKKMQDGKGHKIFIDCTADQTIAESYLDILAAKISIVTPNKRANSGSYDTYKKLQTESKRLGVHYLYEANVEAGLPILNAINSIRQSGDEIVQIEAVLSGTLSYLFNSYDGSIPFSKMVKEAQQKGYTEPDPREDLNGSDVARKLVIIAREAGYPLELAQIDLQQFLPKESLTAPTIDAFYSELEDFDADMAKLAEKAKLSHKKLCSIASFENGRAKLSLQMIEQNHPFYYLTGTDNIISIYTRYYPNNPIVIKGPGAGGEITAARLIEGVIRIGRQ